MRLYQQSGLLRYGQKPVPGAGIDSLDRRRLNDYSVRLRGEDISHIGRDEYRRLLVNLEFATDSAEHTSTTIDGALLFGDNPGRFIPQSGIRAFCYVGREPDYSIRADEDIKGPLVPLGSADDWIFEPGVVDRAWDFVRRNTTPEAYLEGPRRLERWEYPEEAIREAMVNALVHRDYSITEPMSH